MNIRDQVNQKITTNYNNYLCIAKSYSNKKDLPEDILHECLMYMLEFSDEKLETIYLYFDYYLANMIKLSFTSKTSKYQVKYNKMLYTDFDDYYFENIIDDNEEDNYIVHYDINDIEKILIEKCDWLSREVFLRYVKQYKTFKKMSDDTNIPISSLYNSYKIAKKIIKENLYL